MLVAVGFILPDIAKDPTSTSHIMASPVSASTFCCSSSLKSSRTTTLDYAIPSSSCSQLYQYTSRFSLSMPSSQLSQSQLSSWNGLKQLGVSISKKHLVIGRKQQCKGKVVHASLFGVGAPEALVIGVVALLVFGPKGLAEVARNLGKTLRAFQPTIRELQEVSREFKSSLEREIGLDEIPNSSQSSYRSSRPNSVSTSASSSDQNSQAVSESNGASASRAYSSEDYLKMTEEQLQAAASLQRDARSSEEQNPIEANTLPQAQETARETPSTPQSPQNKA